MKTSRFIFTFFLMCTSTCSLSTTEGPLEGKLSEDAQIELLIKATQNTLEQLKNLQEKLRNFRKQESVCIQSGDSTEDLYKLSKVALELLDKIHETCLEPYFRTAFLEELEIIAKAAKKHTIPPVIQ